MYLWQIEYNFLINLLLSWIVVNRFKLCIFDRLNTTRQFLFRLFLMLWIALNYVSLTDWIQRRTCVTFRRNVVNRFKLCIFDRLNTTHRNLFSKAIMLWIALNYVSLTDWIQRTLVGVYTNNVVNRFKLCIFDRLNTTLRYPIIYYEMLWIALNYVSLTDWIQPLKLKYV